MKWIWLLTHLFVGCQVLATNCNLPLAKLANADINWRAGATQELGKGGTHRSSSARESLIKKSIELMEKEVKGELSGNNHSDTPPMIVVPTDGTEINFTQRWQEYGDMHAEVTGAPDGILRATVLVPVSGHTGLANAKRWAKTDTYSLNYKNGSKETPLVSNEKSLDLVTAQEVEIPLVDGKPITLLYYRSGSGGPGGYAGGRILHLTWKKNAPLATQRDYSRPFWRY